jgi:hypothetical protein
MWSINISRHIVQLLGNDLEINNYTTTVVRQWVCNDYPKRHERKNLHCKRRKVLSERSVPGL